MAPSVTRITRDADAGGALGQVHAAQLYVDGFAAPAAEGEDAGDVRNRA
jgi:hypothetical protein